MNLEAEIIANLPSIFNQWTDCTIPMNTFKINTPNEIIKNQFSQFSFPVVKILSMKNLSNNG